MTIELSEYDAVYLIGLGMGVVIASIWYLIWVLLFDR